AVPVGHRATSLSGADAVLIPGGFAFGDHLRAGAIAAQCPVVEAVRQFAAAGGLVLGIGNGFQVLCEAKLLPGVLLPNRSLQFRCEPVCLRTATRRSPFTRAVPAGRVLRLPIAHGTGCYYADPETLATLQARDQVLWEYASPAGHPSDEANPNGSLRNIAGVCNARRNVAGLMPRPERACEAILGSDDGRFVFDGLIAYLREHAATRTA
ncbi:MAG: phosphoribosylformylglycinamidine synthase subunit PurQ, partial [Verrucomicrobiales bacterium]|nr:phosphoribosylformylglycinamidine synthase subunit PurQ [Verrucomicrobiales bacterium]